MSFNTFIKKSPLSKRLSKKIQLAWKTVVSSAKDVESAAKFCGSAAKSVTSTWIRNQNLDKCM